MTTPGASRRRVVVTGVGLLTPLGSDLDSVFASLLAGKTGIDVIEGFDVDGLPYDRGGQLRGFNAADHLEARNLRPLDRTGRMATVAAQRALHHAGWTEEKREASQGSGPGVGLVLGTLFGSVHTISNFDRRALTAGPIYAKPLDFANSVINAAAGQTAIWHTLPGVNSTLGGGPTVGLRAVGYGADLVASGRAEVVLAGGVDELCFESYQGYHKAGLLCGSQSNGEPARPVPFDKRRNGFAPGEGATFLVLEEEAAAKARGATILARLHGHASTFDVSRGEDPASTQHALARAVQSALAGDHGEDSITPEQLAAISASANGSPANDGAEAAGLAEALGDTAHDVPVTAIKSMLGESMGAGGALQVAVLARALTEGKLPGIAGLDEVDGSLPIRSLRAEAQDLNGGRFGLATAIGLYGPTAALLVEAPVSETPAG